jgi:hypothetical protein
VAARKRRPKRTIEETRALMLRAATELVCAGTQDAGERAVASVFAHIRAQQVAEQATRIVRAESGDEHPSPITIGSIYQLWPVQAEFQAELLFHIAELQATLVPGLTDSTIRFKEGITAGVSIPELLRSILDQTHRNTRSDPIFRVVLSFYASAGNDRVRAALAHLYESFTKIVCEAWQSLLDIYHLRMRQPYQVRDLAVAMNALLDGFAMRWIAQPDALSDPMGEGDWSLVTRSAVMLFEQFTEPVPTQ